MKEDLKKAFKYTLPCLFSYIFLGIAFGISLSETGLNWLYSLFCSTFIFAGSMQFMIIQFIKSMEPIYIVALMTVVINARYAFYGISFIDQYKDYEWYRKWYLVHTLSDESYSILVATSLPFKRDSRRYETLVCSFNHIYWIIGCVCGSFLGKLKINFDGIDFVMTALFVVIFIDQLKSAKNHLPAIIGLGSSVICLIVFRKYFILPSLIITLILLYIFRGKIEQKKEDDKDVINEH